MPRPGHLEQFVVAVDNLDCLDSPRPLLAFKKNAIAWNDTDPQIVEYEDDDE